MNQSGSSERKSSVPLIGCLSLVLLPVLLVGGWVWRDSQRGWSAEKLERLIQAELPADCDRQQVETWFDMHGIRYGYCIPGDQPDDDSMPTLAGQIEGKEANVGFLESGRIDIYFYFDKQGRCAGHKVDPFVYSL